MKFIDSYSFSPYFNLALEEYMLKHFLLEEMLVFLWQNVPTVVIGNNQNTVEEINIPYVDTHNIKVVRRLSGGGAVFQDMGNLNFTFLMPLPKANRLDIGKLAFPIVKALQNLGIPAQLSGRNDILVEGKKISGNAQRLYENKLLHHGTLLYDTDLDVLARVLQVGYDKIESKGIKSVRSRVTNIKKYWSKDSSIKQFKDALLNELFQEENIKQYHLTHYDREQVNALVKNKYETWEWNYGYSPCCSLRNSRRFKGGKIEVCLDVEKGMIKNNKIHGDFLSLRDISTIEQALIGQYYRPEIIITLLKKFNLSHYFGDISLEQIMTVFFG